MTEPAIITLSDLQEAVMRVQERAREERESEDGNEDYADGLASGAGMVLMEVTPSGGDDHA